MPKYRMKETTACWVTWTREVEAESLEEAERKFDEGVYELVGEQIGDSISFLDSVIDSMEEV